MRAGRLDRKLDIQRKTVTYSASGSPIETWSNLAARRCASVSPVSGDERFSEPQLAAKEQVEFRVRWSSGISDLTPLDRIVYPASQGGSPAPEVPESSIYDIAAVHEIGRREGLRIIAVRRADT